VQSDRSKLLLAFASVYLIWGSTYLAIRYLVETMPPFASAGARFVVAGLILYGIVRWFDPVRPTPADWRAATIIGGLLLLGGNGLVMFASRVVPSSLNALVIAVTPLWMVLFDWLLFRGERPAWRVVAGLLLGFAGIVVLKTANQPDLLGRQMQWGWLLLPLLACFLWALGSMYSKRVALPSNALLGTAMQMLTGGAALLILATVCGEWSVIDPANFSARSILAWIYLTVFGSLIAFSAYVYMLKHSTPAAAGSYAFVNPLVAVSLGWTAGEPLGREVFFAGALIVCAVMMITLRPKKSASAHEPVVAPEV